MSDLSLGQPAAHHVSGVHGGDLRQRKALVLAEGKRRLAVQPLEAPLRVQVLDLTVRTQRSGQHYLSGAPSHSFREASCRSMHLQTLQHPTTADSHDLL